MKERLKAYVNKELATIIHPTRNTSIVLKNITELVDILYEVFDESNIAPEYIRVKSNFEAGFNVIDRFEKNSLSQAVENLATNFESFLKLLAAIRFKGDTFFERLPDTHYSIGQSTLSDLIKGVIPSKDQQNRYTEALQYPTPLLSKQGFNVAIYNYVVADIRNNVHYAKEYSLIEQARLTNIVLGAYFLALSDNLEFLRKQFFIEYRYIRRVTDDPKLIAISRKTVILTSTKEQTNKFAEDTSERILRDLDDFEGDEEDNELEEKEDSQITSQIDVHTICTSEQFAIVVGGAGSGKTTTLKQILFKYCTEFTINGTADKLPIYIDLSRYSTSCNLVHLIQEATGDIDFTYLSAKYGVVLLIDALNEVHSSVKRLANIDISNFTRLYPRASILIATRKPELVNTWNFPIYELDRLSVESIYLIISARTNSEQQDLLKKTIENNEQLNDLLANPLLLTMLIRLTIQNSLANVKDRATVYRTFYEGILLRDNRLSFENTQMHKDVFGYFSFWTRMNFHTRPITKIDALNIFDRAVKDLGYNAAIQDILANFIHLGFLRSNQDEIQFNHETLQEYFAALEILRRYKKGSKIAFENANIWTDSIAIALCLTTSSEITAAILNHLLRGTGEPSIKPIEELSIGDLSTNLYAYCQVARIIKHHDLTAYQKAEDITINHLVLLACVCMEAADDQFDDLLRSIGTLNSPRVFNKLFSRFRFLLPWLFSSKSGINDNKFPLRLIESFVDELRDYHETYYLIPDKCREILRMGGPPTFNTNVQLLNRTFKERIPLSSLIKIYQSNPTKQLLLHIAYHSPEFLIRHFRDVAIPIQRVCKSLLKRHQQHPVAQQFLVSQFKDDSNSSILRLQILDGLLKYRQLQADLFPHIESLYTNVDTSVVHQNKIRKLLIGIPSVRLQNLNLLQLFTEHHAIKNYPAENPVIDIDNPFLYHPDEIVKLDGIIDQLGLDYNHVASVKDFVDNLGIQHKIINFISTYNVGIPIKIWKSHDAFGVVLYCLTTHDVIKRLMPFEPSESQIFLIEPNQSIHKLSNDEIPKSLFKTGLIVRYDSQRRDGFIRVRDQFDDLYFSGFKCDFIPQVGDYVSFIPGVNTHPNYIGKPLAYLVRSIDQ
jgi:hypothetical protein